MAAAITALDSLEMVHEYLLAPSSYSMRSRTSQCASFPLAASVLRSVKTLEVFFFGAQVHSVNF